MQPGGRRLYGKLAKQVRGQEAAMRATIQKHSAAVNLHLRIRHGRVDQRLPT